VTEPVVHQVLFYDYVEDVLERREPYRPDHLALVQQWHADGTLVMAGALGKPPHGAMFVFLVEDPAEIDGYVAADPYVSGGVVTGHRVVPWTVVVS
jgi:uncharacterized protein YciI